MYLRFSFLLFVFFSVLAIPCTAQNPSNYIVLESAKPKLVKQYLIAKNLAFERNNKEALEILDKLLKKEPTFLDAIFLKAAILYDQGAFKPASQYYEKGLQINEDFDSFMHYQLALCYEQLDNYRDAITYLKKFIDKKNPTSIWVSRAKKKLELFEFRYQLVSNPVSFSPNPLPGKVNTNNLFEYLPTLSADGQLLIYTCRNQGQEDLWFSNLQEGEWSLGRPIPNINTTENEGAQTVSPDGKTIVFTACNRPDGVGSCDLYITNFNGNNWSTPINMGNKINSNAWESQPCLADNGNRLFFASNRAGGIGGSDIWYSQKSINGEWSSPIVLDSTVNSKEDDQAPFFHPDNQTLYFMSKGHLGMGGFDLFKSEKSPNGKWSKPQNLGYPINTKANEGALFVSLDGLTGYYDSDLTGKADIYTFNIPTPLRPQKVTYVKCTVLDATNRNPLEATVVLSKLNSLDTATQEKHSPQTFFSTDPKDGSFLICLPFDSDYGLQIELPGYFFYSRNFALQSMQLKDSIFQITALLEPIIIGDSTVENEMVLNNIFFELGTSKLNPESFFELDRLVNLLLNNPKLRIRINGHTDNIGTEEDNLILSEKRALAVFQYLVNQGIETNRLQYKGFGEQQPLFDNNSEENRAKNRRTSFQVLRID